MAAPGNSGRRAVRAMVATTLGAVLVAVTASVSTPAPVHAAPIAIDIARPGPLGPVTVIGDSVLLGSGLTSPTLPDQLAAAGWGPIRFYAGEGVSAGNKPVASTFKATYWLDTWRAQGWDAPNVIVNIGANDSGFCDTNQQCARAAILHVVDRIGPGHRIWWPKITRLYTKLDQQNNWNAALAEIAAERDDFFTWDWPTVMASEGYASPDGTHLTAAGYRQRSHRMAQQFTLDVARARRTGPDAALPTGSTTTSTYLPLPPERILDTRSTPPGRRPARSTMRVDLGDAIPAGTTAVAIGVTAADPAGRGYLSASRCGAPTTASTVNFTVGQSRGAMTVVPVDASGDVCVYAHVATDVVVDLQGAFVGGGTGSRLTPTSPPRRLLDTRVSGRRSVLEVPVPVTATAVAVTLTATGSAKRGFLRASACAPDDLRPGSGGVSNVNFGPGESVAGTAFVPTSPSHTICIVSNVSTDVVVDLTAAFAPAGALAFRPATPTRVLDTRSGIGGWSPIHGSEQSFAVRVAPSDARAATGTITTVGPLARGFVAVSPSTATCAGVPSTSSVNALTGVVMANSVTVGTPGGRVCVYANRATQTLFDTTGWWVP